MGGLVSMRWIARVGAIGVTVSVCATAPAQVHESQRRAAERADESRAAIVTMHRFGTCVAFRSRHRAERVLATLPSSAEERQVLGQVARAGCLDDMDVDLLSFHPQLLRGAMAEAYFEADFGQVGGPPRRAMATPFPSVTAKQVAALPARGPKILRALVFAHCVVEAAPDDVVALLRTDPATPAEEAAFGSLLPRFAPCLDAGVRLEVSRPQVRGILAEAAYRISHARAVAAR